MTIVRIEEGLRYSQAVVHGDTVYLAGQVGDPSDNVSEQARQVFDKIDSLLGHAGSDRRHLLQATVLLADMADYDAMNSAWDVWLAGSPKPARATSGSVRRRPGTRSRSLQRQHYQRRVRHGSFVRLSQNTISIRKAETVSLAVPIGKARRR